MATADAAGGTPGPAEDTPTEFDWLTLDEGEEVLWVGEPHVYSIVPALAVGIPLSLLLVGIPIVVAAYLGRENTVYLLTDQGLYHKKGIVSRDVQRVEFDKVQNISFSQGALGAQFGYGNVDVSTAGGSGVEMQFRSVADPKSVQERINRQIRRTRSADAGEDPSGTSPEDVLDDILAELRAIRAAVEGGRGAGGSADGVGDAPPTPDGDGGDRTAAGDDTDRTADGTAFEFGSGDDDES